jgi:hypothetical protein
MRRLPIVVFKRDRSSPPPTATQKLAAILESCAD